MTRTRGICTQFFSPEEFGIFGLDGESGGDLLIGLFTRRNFSLVVFHADGLGADLQIVLNPGGNIQSDQILDEPQDFLSIRKFVPRTKGSKCKIVNGQIFEKAAKSGDDSE